MRYDLFFTTERVIAVIIQHPADSFQAKSMWHYMFVGSFWSAGRRKIDQERATRKKRRGLQSMTPDELVKADPRNLYIPYSEIASVEIARHFFQWQLIFRVPGLSDRERIASFNMSKKQVAEAERLLKLASLSETPK